MKEFYLSKIFGLYKNFQKLCFLIVLSLLSGFITQTNAQIFSQDFNSSTNLNDYFSTSPTANQFRSIGTFGTATIDVSSNALAITTKPSSGFWVERNVDFTPIPLAVKFQFDVSLSGAVNNTQAIIVAVIGSNVGDTTSIGSFYTRWGISGTGTSGEFKVWSTSGDGSTTFTGTQTVTTFCNNTGASINYIAPNDSTESIANDKVDIWVGNKKEFNDIIANNPFTTLARFKFIWGNPVNGAIVTLDNIIINEISIVTAVEDYTAIPTMYTLEQNYPNPFNPSTKIRFGIPQESNVRIMIYNMLGQEVQRLFSGNKSAGFYEISFDAGKLSSGMYIYRIEAGSFVETKKMLLMK